MNGKASQVFRIRTETLAQNALPSQGTSLEPDRIQELVQVAEVVVEDAAPGEDRDRRGKRPGDDQERPVEAALGEPLVVEQEGEREADAKLRSVLSRANTSVHCSTIQNVPRSTPNSTSR